MESIQADIVFIDAGLHKVIMYYKCPNSHMLTESLFWIREPTKKSSSLRLQLQTWFLYNRLNSLQCK